MNEKPCVFVVDDDEAIRDSLKMVLESIHITCLTYENAEQFLASYHSETV
ncbi:DNA-binding response regulator, partial [Nitrosomonas supralitoralis]